MPTRAHPLINAYHKSDDKVKTYLGKVRTAFKYLIPLQADLLFRILYRVLPVGYEFFKTQLIISTIIECVHPRCHAIVTVVHTLHLIPM